MSMSRQIRVGDTVLLCGAAKGVRLEGEQSSQRSTAGYLASSRSFGKGSGITKTSAGWSLQTATSQQVGDFSEIAELLALDKKKKAKAGSKSPVGAARAQRSASRSPRSALSSSRTLELSSSTGGRRDNHGAGVVAPSRTQGSRKREWIPPANIHECLFVVHAVADDFEEQSNTEDGRVNGQPRNGDGVQYGQSVQLMHVLSGLLLGVGSKVDRERMGGNQGDTLTIRLVPVTDSVRSWMTLIPRYRSHSYGDPVGFADEVLISDRAQGRYLRARTTRTDDEDHDHFLDSRIGCEVCVSVEASTVATGWQFVPFSQSMERGGVRRGTSTLPSSKSARKDNPLRGGDLIRLLHFETESLLSFDVLNELDGGLVSAVSAVLHMRHSEQATEKSGHAASLWAVIPTDVWWGGKAIYPYETVRIQHVVTGKYLCAEPVSASPSRVRLKNQITRVGGTRIFLSDDWFGEASIFCFVPADPVRDEDNDDGVQWSAAEKAPPHIPIAMQSKVHLLHKATDTFVHSDLSMGLSHNSVVFDADGAKTKNSSSSDVELSLNAMRELWEQRQHRSRFEISVVTEQAAGDMMLLQSSTIDELRDIYGVRNLGRWLEEATCGLKVRGDAKQDPIPTYVAQRTVDSLRALIDFVLPAQNIWDAPVVDDETRTFEAQKAVASAGLGGAAGLLSGGSSAAGLLEQKSPRGLTPRGDAPSEMLLRHFATTGMGMMQNLNTPADHFTQISPRAKPQALGRWRMIRRVLGVTTLGGAAQLNASDPTSVQYIATLEMFSRDLWSIRGASKNFSPHRPRQLLLRVMGINTILLTLLDSAMAEYLHSLQPQKKSMRDSRSMPSSRPEDERLKEFAIRQIVLFGCRLITVLVDSYPKNALFFACHGAIGTFERRLTDFAAVPLLRSRRLANGVIPEQLVVRELLSCLGHVFRGNRLLLIELPDAIGHVEFQLLKMLVDLAADDDGSAKRSVQRLSEQRAWALKLLSHFCVCREGGVPRYQDRLTAMLFDHESRYVNLIPRLTLSTHPAYGKDVALVRPDESEIFLREWLEKAEHAEIVAFKAALKLCWCLCVGRRYPSMDAIRPRLPPAVLFFLCEDPLASKALPIPADIRSKVCDLIDVLYLDASPHHPIHLVHHTRIWKHSADPGASDSSLKNIGGKLYTDTVAVTRRKKRRSELPQDNATSDSRPAFVGRDTQLHMSRESEDSSPRKGKLPPINQSSSTESRPLSRSHRGHVKKRRDTTDSIPGFGEAVLDSDTQTFDQLPWSRLVTFCRNYLSWLFDKFHEFLQPRSKVKIGAADDKLAESYQDIPFGGSMPKSPRKSPRNRSSLEGIRRMSLGLKELDSGNSNDDKDTTKRQQEAHAHLRQHERLTFSVLHVVSHMVEFGILTEEEEIRKYFTVLTQVLRLSGFFEGEITSEDDIRSTFSDVSPDKSRQEGVGGNVRRTASFSGLTNLQSEKLNPLSGKISQSSKVERRSKVLVCRIIDMLADRKVDLSITEFLDLYRDHHRSREKSNLPLNLNKRLEISPRIVSEVNNKVFNKADAQNIAFAYTDTLLSLLQQSDTSLSIISFQLLFRSYMHRAEIRRFILRTRILVSQHEVSAYFVAKAELHELKKGLIHGQAQALVYNAIRSQYISSALEVLASLCEHKDGSPKREIQSLLSHMAVDATVLELFRILLSTRRALSSMFVEVRFPMEEGSSEKFSTSHGGHATITNLVEAAFDFLRAFVRHNQKIQSATWIAHGEQLWRLGGVGVSVFHVSPDRLGESPETVLVDTFSGSVQWVDKQDLRARVRTGLRRREKAIDSTLSVTLPHPGAIHLVWELIHGNPEVAELVATEQNVAAFVVGAAHLWKSALHLMKMEMSEVVRTPRNPNDKADLSDEQLRDAESIISTTDLLIRILRVIHGFLGALGAMAFSEGEFSSAERNHPRTQGLVARLLFEHRRTLASLISLGIREEHPNSESRNTDGDYFSLPILKISSVEAHPYLRALPFLLHCHYSLHLLMDRCVRGRNVDARSTLQNVVSFKNMLKLYEKSAGLAFPEIAQNARSRLDSASHTAPDALSVRGIYLQLINALFLDSGNVEQFSLDFPAEVKPSGILRKAPRREPSTRRVKFSETVDVSQAQFGDIPLKQLNRSPSKPVLVDRVRGQASESAMTSDDTERWMLSVQRYSGQLIRALSLDTSRIAAAKNFSAKDLFFLRRRALPLLNKLFHYFPGCETSKHQCVIMRAVLAQPEENSEGASESEMGDSPASRSVLKKRSGSKEPSFAESLVLDSIASLAKHLKEMFGKCTATDSDTVALRAELVETCLALCQHVLNIIPEEDISVSRGALCDIQAWAEKADVPSAGRGMNSGWITQGSRNVDARVSGFMFSPGRNQLNQEPQTLHLKMTPSESTTWHKCGSETLDPLSQDINDELQAFSQAFVNPLGEQRTRRGFVNKLMSKGTEKRYQVVHKLMSLLSSRVVMDELVSLGVASHESGTREAFLGSHFEELRHMHEDMFVASVVECLRVLREVYNVQSDQSHQTIDQSRSKGRPRFTMFHRGTRVSPEQQGGDGTTEEEDTSRGVVESDMDSSPAVQTIVNFLSRSNGKVLFETLRLACVLFEERVQLQDLSSLNFDHRKFHSGPTRSQAMKRTLLAHFEASNDNALLGAMHRHVRSFTKQIRLALQHHQAVGLQQQFGVEVETPTKGETASAFHPDVMLQYLRFLQLLCTSTDEHVVGTQSASSVLKDLLREQTRSEVSYNIVREVLGLFVALHRACMLNIQSIADEEEIEERLTMLRILDQCIQTLLAFCVGPNRENQLVVLEGTKLFAGAKSILSVEISWIVLNLVPDHPRGKVADAISRVQHSTVKLIRSLLEGPEYLYPYEDRNANSRRVLAQLMAQIDIDLMAKNLQWVVSLQRSKSEDPLNNEFLARAKSWEKDASQGSHILQLLLMQYIVVKRLVLAFRRFSRDGYTFDGFQSVTKTFEPFIVSVEIARIDLAVNPAAIGAVSLLQGRLSDGKSDGKRMDRFQQGVPVEVVTFPVSEVAVAQWFRGNARNRHRLIKEMRVDILNKLSREKHHEKLNKFFDRAQDLIFAMEHWQFLTLCAGASCPALDESSPGSHGLRLAPSDLGSQARDKFPGHGHRGGPLSRLTSMVALQHNKIEILCIWLTIAANIVLLVGYDAAQVVDRPPSGPWGNISSVFGVAGGSGGWPYFTPSWLRLVLLGLGTLHVLFSVLRLTSHIVAYSPVENHKLYRHKANKALQAQQKVKRHKSFWRRLRKPPRRIRLWWHLIVRRTVYLVLSLGALILAPLYAALLFDIVFQFRLLRSLLSIFTKNGRMLTQTGLLGLLVVYIYACIGFMVFRDDYNLESGATKRGPCDNLFECALYQLGPGMLSDGGIFGALQPPGAGLSWRRVGRVIFDLSYFLLVLVVLTSVVSGIIIDAFLAIRSALSDIRSELSTKCFVCGLSSSLFDRQGAGFRYHVQREHNMWDYMFFFMFLREEGQMAAHWNTPGVSFAKNMVRDRDLGFFPDKQASTVRM